LLECGRTRRPRDPAPRLARCGPACVRLPDSTPRRTMPDTAHNVIW